MENNSNFYPTVRSTTVIGMIKNGKGALAADGQVTFGNTVMKHTTRKIRKLYNEKILVGFAGSTADAFTLMELFDKKLEAFNGKLYKSAVELAKEWRTDKYLQKLEAMLIAMDAHNIVLISGTGDVLVPDNNIIAIGSGGMYAYAAAQALDKFSTLEAKDIVKESLKIASGICIYTNDQIVLEEI